MEPTNRSHLIKSSFSDFASVFSSELTFEILYLHVASVFFQYWFNGGLTLKMPSLKKSTLKKSTFKKSTLKKSILKKVNFMIVQSVKPSISF